MEDKGIIWVPYTIKTVSTSINGETVWYANKWKNLLLKIKHFFIKPKYLKNTHIYKNKPVNPSFYRKMWLCILLALAVLTELGFNIYFTFFN